MEVAELRERVGLRDRGDVVAQAPGDLLEVGVVPVARGDRGCGALDHLARLQQVLERDRVGGGQQAVVRHEELADAADRRLDDEVAARHSLAGVDQVAGREDAERLAHGRARHAEIGRELGFAGQAVTRLELAAVDHLQELVGDLLVRFADPLDLHASRSMRCSAVVRTQNVAGARCDGVVDERPVGELDR